MPLKLWITLGLIVGSTIGSYLPTLWGASLLSLASVIGTFITAPEDHGFSHG